MSIAAISHALTAPERRSAAPQLVGAPQPVQGVAPLARERGGSATAQALPAADVPDEPRPVTTATVAVHIMKVPSSRVLEAFVSMHRTLGRQDEATSADVPSAVTVERNKAAHYQADAERSGTTPAGTVVDLRV
jgi:hypothetical protein